MHKFNPAHLDRLMSDERLAEISPEKVLREAGLRQGQVFADIGSGPGFFTIPAARIIGPMGLAFAIDTQAEMLIDLRDRRNPPDNIVLMKSEEYELPIGDYEADFALLAFVLHEVPDKARLLKEIKRVMKPGATFLLLDWVKKAEDKGPPMEERISDKQAREFAEEAGFDVVQLTLLTPSHYRIIARKPA